MDPHVVWLASPHAAALAANLRAMHSEAALAILQSFKGSAEALGQLMLAHQAKLDVVSGIELMHSQARQGVLEQEAKNNE